MEVYILVGAAVVLLVVFMLRDSRRLWRPPRSRSEHDLTARAPDGRDGCVTHDHRDDSGSGWGGGDGGGGDGGGGGG